ncbi:MAG: hypothetical protein FWG63_08755 [Defluviitaleaceae bacterium]|nr:hypothetical protein [Defluviitaleaceae bacterium]
MAVEMGVREWKTKFVKHIAIVGRIFPHAKANKSQTKNAKSQKIQQKIFAHQKITA